MMVSFRQRRLSGGRFAHLMILILGLAAIPLLASACRSSASASTPGEVRIDLRLLTEKTTGPATFEVMIQAAGGEPVDGAEVTVRGDMSHAGMKPVLAGARGEGEGRYITDGFEFTMAGDWIVTAEVVLPGGVTAARTIDVTGVVAR